MGKTKGGILSRLVVGDVGVDVEKLKQVAYESKDEEAWQIADQLQLQEVDGRWPQERVRLTHRLGNWVGKLKGGREDD